MQTNPSMDIIGIQRVPQKALFGQFYQILKPRYALHVPSHNLRPDNVVHTAHRMGESEHGHRLVAGCATYSWPTPRGISLVDESCTAYIALVLIEPT